jgi:polyhydroxyalkanoate synthesis regulator phasin
MDPKENETADKDNLEDFPFHHFLRRMVLASIGMLSYSQEEWEKFMDKMVERGEITHKDHEERMKEIRKRREEFLHNRKTFTQKRVAKALDQFEVPNKTDIDDINAKISALEKQIDELKKPSK